MELKPKLRVLITLLLADTEASALSEGGLSVIAISRLAWVPERNESVAAIKTEYSAEGTLLFSAALAGLRWDRASRESASISNARSPVKLLPWPDPALYGPLSDALHLDTEQQSIRHLRLFVALFPYNISVVLGRRRNHAYAFLFSVARALQSISPISRLT